MYAKVQNLTTIINVTYENSVHIHKYVDVLTKSHIDIKKIASRLHEQKSSTKKATRSFAISLARFLKEKFLPLLRILTRAPRGC